MCVCACALNKSFIMVISRCGSMKILISTISVFFFLPILLRYNRHRELYKVKV